MGRRAALVRGRVAYYSPELGVSPNSAFRAPWIEYTAHMAGGIVFLRTAQFETVRTFYMDRIGMAVWLDQPDISILRHGNLLVGFHRQSTPDLDALLTFFYDSRAEVDAMYAKLKDIATTEPRENPKYRIYNFIGVDPEGRTVEFQHFLHPIPRIYDAG